VSGGMPVVDDQIADIRDPGKSIGKDENRISLVKQGIAQEQ